MIAIVDYGVGNLFSLRCSLLSLGLKASVTADPEEIRRADRVILPGVGAFGDAIDKLRATGLDRTVLAEAERGKPLLGICLGMQILFDHSEEDGGVDCLGIISGNVRRFPTVPGFKVPEIGWNGVEGLDGKEFYFVHSYYAEVVPETVGVTEYAGVKFTAMVKKGRLWACQFHPEKSGRIGLELIKEWLSC